MIQSWQDSSVPTPSSQVRAIRRRSTEKLYTADPNSDTLTGAGRNFAWTADNRVASVTMGGTTTMDYDYTGEDCTVAEKKASTVLKSFLDGRRLPVSHSKSVVASTPIRFAMALWVSPKILRASLSPSANELG